MRKVLYVMWIVTCFLSYLLHRFSLRLVVMDINLENPKVITCYFLWRCFKSVFILWKRALRKSRSYWVIYFNQKKKVTHYKIICSAEYSIEDITCFFVHRDYTVMFGLTKLGRVEIGGDWVRPLPNINYHIPKY